MKNEESCLWLNASWMPPPDKLKIKSNWSFHREDSCVFRRVTVKIQFPQTERTSTETGSAASFLRPLLSSAHPMVDTRCPLRSLDGGSHLSQSCETTGKFCAGNSWKVCPTGKFSFVRLSKSCHILLQKRIQGEFLFLWSSGSQKTRHESSL